MGWIYLLIAGFFEIAFTTSMKLSDNFSNIFWTIIFVISSILSLFFLNKSVALIPLGTAYVVWTGIGAIGTVTIGILLFNEPVNALKMLFMVLIIGSIIGLKATA